ncbi:MAG: DUF2461 domain-containing protein [Clostridia bacterium]|nr:DUF2461 domain-containing protein [Clostridia bacterium]
MSREAHMFSGFSEETIQFFLDLKFNNYTDYFHQQHDRYIETVQKPFYEMIEDLGPAMLKIDPEMEVRPYKCLSRIHRDTRFSRDKSPYRDHLWFLFRKAAEPRDRSLFYYFELGPDRLSWGMGFWNENREALDIFRKRMRANPEGMLAFLNDLELEKRHLLLGGSVHKKMALPPEIPERLKRWYLAKDFYIGKWMPDYRQVYTEKICGTVRKDFQAMAPLYRLLRGYADEILQTGGE